MGRATTGPSHQGEERVVGLGLEGLDAGLDALDDLVLLEELLS